MAAESQKLRSLREIRTKLELNRFKQQELQQLRVADVDGRLVRLSDDEAMQVLERRIAAEVQEA